MSLAASRRFNQTDIVVKPSQFRGWNHQRLLADGFFTENNVIVTSGG